jgi:S-adenosyl-L-methionine hydrolase (adenosine-forming)
VHIVGRRYDTVTFMSDLGTADEQAGVVRAVLRDLAPGAVVLDLTHDLPTFDVRAASLALARAVAYLPEGVILVGVDPSPGERPAVAIEVADGAGVFLGPDNGVLAPGVAMAGGAGRAVLLDDESMHLGSGGSTFRARDVLAPVAARLCNGVDLGELGTAIDPAALMPAVVPLPRDEGDTVVAEVLWVDRFGNAQLNVGPEDLTARWPIAAGSAVAVTVRDLAGNPLRRVATWVAAYHDVAAGAVGLVIDSSGMLTLCGNRTSAATEVGVAAGDQVVLAAVEPGDHHPGVTTTVNLRRG